MSKKEFSWQRAIDFQCTFGVWPFKKSLEISPRGFNWCGELLPLKGITRLRWGVDLLRGGIFPKRRYIAVFGTEEREFTIKTKQKDFYEHLTDRLWRAVGKRLFAEMLDGLARGEKFTFGECVVEDTGITIVDKRLLGSVEAGFYKWDELKWGIVNGGLCFVPAAEQSKILASCSFLWVDNAHILNVALGLLERSESKVKLSALR